MTITVIDEQSVTRELICENCRQLGHAVVGAAGDWVTGLSYVVYKSPDIIILGLQIGGQSGLELLKVAQEAGVAARVLATAPNCSRYVAFEVGRSPICGFIDFNTVSRADLREAIEAVCDGRVYYSAALCKMRATLHDDPRSFDKWLTGREIAVLALVGSDFADEEMGRILGIGSETVRKHRRNVGKKLGLPSRLDVQTYAHEEGFPRIDRKASSLAKIGLSLARQALRDRGQAGVVMPEHYILRPLRLRAVRE